MTTKPALAVAALAIALSSCASSDQYVDSIVLPPANAGLDYQLGGAYEPTSDTAIVARDRTAAPDPDRYNICYVNGFQTQPDEAAIWLVDNQELLLRDGNGTPLIDPDWPDEYILDTSTATKRERLLAIVGVWIDGCNEWVSIGRDRQPRHILAVSR